MGKTATAVHSVRQMMTQRRQAFIRDRYMLGALSTYAQICIGFSLYLYGRVSTPGYISLLLTVPAVLPHFLMGWFLHRRKKPGRTVAASAAGAVGEKAFALCFSLLHLLDAQIAFFALCAMARDVMPDAERLPFALAAAFFCACGGADQNSLSRLGCFLKWIIAALALYGASISFPHGKISHFYPLLGYGASSILRGALWMSGAVVSGVWPLLNREENEPPVSFFTAARFPLAAVGLGIFTYLTAVWLMPVYAMSRPESVGWRILLIAHMTPSVPAWSAAVIGLLLLLLTAVSGSVSQAALALSRLGGKRKPPRFLHAALLFLLVPACAINPDTAQKILTAAAPWRAAAALALLSMLCLVSLLRRKQKNALPKEKS